MIEKDVWHSPTDGILDFESVAKNVVNLVENNIKDKVQLIIGTDSTLKDGGAEFVVAIILHHVGRGGRYFWKRIAAHGDKPENKEFRILRNRIYKEATLSLDTAHQLIDYLRSTYAFLTDLEIHVDVGRVGATREIISEVTGMVKGSGFAVKTKPEAFAASSVADRHV